MKTEFLKELGLDEEVIKKIMAENGKDVEAEKKKTTKAEEDRDNYKGQLETAQTALKEFDGIDVKDMQNKIATLNTDLANKEKEYQGKLAERDFDDSLKSAIASAGGKNVKAIKALLDTEALKSSKNREADIKAAIEACQKDNDYLFGANEPINNPVGPTGGGTGGIDATESAIRAAMGLPPEK